MECARILCMICMQLLCITLSFITQKQGQICEHIQICDLSRDLSLFHIPPGSRMPDLEYQYSCTRILAKLARSTVYTTVVLGSYTAVQHGSYCIAVLAVRILLYELYSTVLYCTTSIGHLKSGITACKKSRWERDSTRE